MIKRNWMWSLNVIDYWMNSIFPPFFEHAQKVKWRRKRNFLFSSRLVRSQCWLVQRFNKSIYLTSQYWTIEQMRSKVKTNIKVNSIKCQTCCEVNDNEHVKHFSNVDGFDNFFFYFLKFWSNLHLSWMWHLKMLPKKLAY